MNSFTFRCCRIKKKKMGKLKNLFLEIKHKLCKISDADGSKICSDDIINRSITSSFFNATIFPDSLFSNTQFMFCPQYKIPRFTTAQNKHSRPTCHARIYNISPPLKSIVGSKK